MATHEEMDAASAPLAAVLDRKPFDHSVTLRDHVDASLIIREFIAEHEGELTPEIEALMLDNENQTKEKVTAIGWYVKQETSRIKAEKELIDNLVARRRAAENRVEWLKQSYLNEQMGRLGLKAGDSLKGVGVTVAYQLNNPALDGEVAEERLIDLILDPIAKPLVRYVPEAYQLDKRVALDQIKQANGIIALAENAEEAMTEAEQESLAWARALVAKFPELSVKRELSVRVR